MILTEYSIEWIEIDASQAAGETIVCQGESRRTAMG
jgi:hypothetical protein